MRKSATVHSCPWTKRKSGRSAKKWGLTIPQNERAFWAGVHKVIYHTTAATAEQKANSAAWLREHGFSTEIQN